MRAALALCSALWAAGLALWAPAAWAEQTCRAASAVAGCVTGGGGTLTTAARLDLRINIDKMVFLRVGAGSGHTGAASGTGPAANGTVSTVAFSRTFSIPATPTAPSAGNSQAVAWSGAAPTASTSTGVVLPVEVRSNAGQVRVNATPSTLLTSGANTIPMSEISITSSDAANLPAPVVPNSGSGANVNVALGGAGTAAAPTFLTYRSADWTFGYTAATVAAAGTYVGEITFTASVL